MLKQFKLSRDWGMSFGGHIHYENCWRGPLVWPKPTHISQSAPRGIFNERWPRGDSVDLARFLLDASHLSVII